MTREEILEKIERCQREINWCVAYQVEKQGPDIAGAIDGEMDWRIALADWEDELKHAKP